MMPEHNNSRQDLELVGRIERVVFHNSENGFTVLKVGSDDKPRPVSVVATMFDPQPGRRVRAMGRWIMNPKYGEQFKAESCEVLLPASGEGVKGFLQSGLIKGVGTKYADRIVEKFGDQTLDILDNHPERLLEVEGIGKKRLKTIIDSWTAQRDIRRLMIFLQGHGVSAAYAVRIFKAYGLGSVDLIGNNPYRISVDIAGFGFMTADMIARKLGFAEDNPQRIRAGLVHILSRTADDGHVYIPYENLVQAGCELLNLDPVLVEPAVNALAGEEKLIIEDNIDPDGPAVYPVSFHVAEAGIASMLGDFLNRSKKIHPGDPVNSAHIIEQKERITFAQDQHLALQQAAESKALVLTGGPGTGKTTIIKAVLSMYRHAGGQVLLAAPTGRAAKRMSEAAGWDASTVHRLLEYNPVENVFQRNAENPLECDLLIVDEASMLDTLLTYYLCKALPPKATLILVGDINQLPSVGAGNILRDIIDSGVVPVVTLTEIFRQARQSSIIVNAHLINSGKIPNLEPVKEDLDDFYFIHREDPEEALQTVLGLVRERIPESFGFDPCEDIQVLSPMHKGVVGASNLNKHLQQSLNPLQYGMPEIARGDKRFRPGDRIMQIRNNYDKEIFNGDVGRILTVDKENISITAEFYGRTLTLDTADLDEIVPAYAVTIHKSQGSEYSAVVVPILTQHYLLLQRNLLYTAVTRGKQLTVLVGSKKALHIAVRNNSGRTRLTGLAKRLQIATKAPTTLRFQTGDY